MIDDSRLDEFLDGLANRYFAICKILAAVRVLDCACPLHVENVGRPCCLSGRARVNFSMCSLHVSCLNLRPHRLDVLIITDAIEVLVQALQARVKELSNWRLLTALISSCQS